MRRCCDLTEERVLKHRMRLVMYIKMLFTTLYRGGVVSTARLLPG